MAIKEGGAFKLPKLTAISTALIPNRTKLQVFPYYFNAFHFVSGFGHNEMLESRMAELISNKIQIYDAQLGYPSGLTSDVVIEHLWEATMAFHILRDLRKRMNAAELTDSHGINIGWAFSSKIVPMFIVEPGDPTGPNYYVYLPTIEWDEKPLDQFHVVEVPRVSNKEWSEMVGRAEGLIMIPKAWAAIISYYADNVFSLISRDDDGHTQFINFQTPSTDTHRNSTWVDDWKVLSGYLEGMDSRFKEYPTLRLFLSSHMGIDRVLNQFDFSRDASSRTLSIMNDTDILDAIETSPNVFFDGFQYGDDEYLGTREVMYTPGDIYMSPLDFDDFIEVDTDSILEKLLLSTHYDGNEPIGGYVPPILSTFVAIDAYKKNGSNPIVFNLPPGTLYFGGSPSANTTSVVTWAMDNFPLDLPFRPEYILSEARTIDGKIHIKQGFNLYSVSETDFLTVKLDKCLSLLFGGIPFKYSYPNPILYDGQSDLINPTKSSNKLDSNNTNKDTNKGNSKSKNKKRSKNKDKEVNKK